MIHRTEQPLRDPVRTLRTLASFISFVLMMAAAGCSSSNSTQQDASGSPPDSSAIQATGRLQATGHRSSRRSSRARNQQGFVTQEDTIDAEVVTRNHTAGHVKPPAKGSSKKKFYSVQVGAFHEINNAIRAKNIAQERYRKTVFLFYEKGIRMYRVTVGNFTKLKAGLDFLKKMQKEHAKEYKNAWVAEMRR